MVFSRKPSKILDYIGKFLNPVFLVLLGIVVVLAFIKPMGGISHAPVSANYSDSVLLKGFIDGYNTLDALASLAFGIIIVTTIKKLGITNPNGIAKETFKSGFISIVGMGVIYTLLALMGTMSLGHFKVSENGGIALAQIAQRLSWRLRYYHFISNHYCCLFEDGYWFNYCIFRDIYRTIPENELPLVSNRCSDTRLYLR